MLRDDGFMDQGAASVTGAVVAGVFLLVIFVLTRRATQT
jgi:hypothetical protein